MIDGKVATRMSLKPERGKSKTHTFNVQPNAEEKSSHVLLNVKRFRSHINVA